MGKISQYICLTIILLILSSCRNKPLSNVNFSNGSYKLYFITPQTDSAFYQPNKFQVDHKNFFISNNEALEIIQRKIIKERVKNEHTFNSFYKLRLTNNSKTIIDGGILDIKNNILLYHNGNYHFDFEKFLELEKEFVELNAYEVNFITASNTKKFIHFVDSTEGFIDLDFKEGKNPLIDAAGIVTLSSDTSNIIFGEGIEVYEEKFKNDFKNIGEVKLLRLSYQGGDSITTTMIWKKDLTSDLPNGYRILKPFSDTINFPIRVFDVSSKEISNFIKRERIKGVKLKSLN